MTAGPGSVADGTAPDHTLEGLLRSALHGEGAPVVRAAVAGAAAALHSAPPVADPDPAHRAADRLSALLVETEATITVPSVAPLVPATAHRAAVAGTVPAAPQHTAGPQSVARDPDRTVGRRSGGDLRELVAAFRADPAVARVLGTPAAAAQGPDDPAAWAALWLSFLRLPDDVAAPWRTHAVGLYPNDGSTGWVELPGAGEVLVAPAPGLGVPGVRESPDVGPAAWILATAPDVPAAVLVLIDQVDRMIEIDDGLHHALESRRRTGFHRLADTANRRDLRNDLRYVLDDLAATPAGSVAALEALRRVDEVLCSVVHVPPAVPESWWGRLAGRSRAVLLAAAADLRARGEDVEVRAVPFGDYAEHRDLIGSNVACPAPGRPESEVLACLRVWLRVGNDRRLGRVIRVRNTM